LKPRSVTTKPSESLSLAESSPAEEAAAIEKLRALPRRETWLTYRAGNGWHVLGYRSIGFTKAEDYGRILVTKSFERLARTLEALYQERRLNPPAMAVVPRKPAAKSRKNASTTKHHPPAARYA
jgi:hypothetical protein